MASIDHKSVGLQGPGVGLAIVGLVFAVLSSATVTGRILSRVTAKRILGKDDYIMVASVVSHPAIFSTIRNLRFRLHVLITTHRLVQLPLPSSQPWV